MIVLSIVHWNLLCEETLRDGHSILQVTYAVTFLKGHTFPRGETALSQDPEHTAAQ